ncbi:MAG: RrF2 family transcriptional regulator [Phycisphaerae bacterium]
MLSLTKRTEYAIIALCHLARGDGSVASARDIASQYGMKLPLMMGVLKTLHQRGFLRSIRGVHGGYLLAVRAEDVSIRRLVEGIEGPAKLIKCAPPEEPGEGCCELMGSCPVRVPVLRLHRALEAFLDSYTIADVAFDGNFGANHEPQSETALKVLAR